MLVDDDSNLKYLGLQALSVVAPKHLWAVLENKEVVIKSLSDVDPNIKLESLRLVMAMVSESNVAEISRVLVNYALKSDPEFCNLILGSILSTCCRNVYEIIMDFDWYVSLLGEMSRIPHCQKGEEIEKQLIDIGMRVKDVRPELVRVSRDLLIDPHYLVILSYTGYYRPLLGCQGNMLSSRAVTGFKEKPNHTKPRPVVVKLDGDQVPIAAGPHSQEDLLSGTVRDVLLGSETKPTTRSSTKRKGKEKLNGDSTTESKENLGDVEKQDQGNSSNEKKQA
ncbi:hypothetical protein J5N97_002036 [Dioscorea zingiberensis]|uniref:Clathrin/coatomer adaptor adaptin-like N-terminal domain-containing protein n=1 Tax=Dioscorea zingiberensis TaxID=325984 RepID=A0A9D5H1Z0_9LILI|nr:hypothetical protein J5N97_002036 [Dioscorea zingiberensis]